MKDTLEVLRKDVEIPEVVQKKANEAFAMIQCEAAAEKYDAADYKYGSSAKVVGSISKNGNASMNRNGSKNRGTDSMKNRSWKMVMAGAAATLAVGTLTVVSAAYLKWSAGLEKELQVTEEQKQAAVDSGLASFPEMSVTDGGVTVTAEQSIVDNYYAYLSFKVEGYDVEAGEEPGFDSVEVTVDGEVVTSGSSFYDGLISGDDGRCVMADGSEIPVDEDGNSLIDYTMEDGSLEYRINLSGKGEKGWLIGKDVHVALTDLGVYSEKAGDVIDKVEGTWEFDWTFEGDDTSYVAEVDEALGDTGAVIKEVEVSPISLRAVYEWPRQEVTETAYATSTEEVDGELVETTEPIEHTSYVDPPRLTGVKLKDGTLLKYVYMGPGSEGYVDNESDQYEIRFAIDRILDVNEVQSLLFGKEILEGEEELTEEDFYVVDIR